METTKEYYEHLNLVLMWMRWIKIFDDSVVDRLREWTLRRQFGFFCSVVRMSNAVDTSGWTALHYASCYGATDVVKELLALGADVDRRNDVGNTPLIIRSSITITADIAALLIEAGADVKLRNNYGDICVGHCTTVWQCRNDLVVDESCSTTRSDDAVELHASNGTTRTTYMWVLLSRDCQWSFLSLRRHLPRSPHNGTWYRM